MSSRRAHLVYPRFVRALETESPLPVGARVRVAFSGGPDSTALLFLFALLRERRRPDLQLSAGHVHHGARGAEADADATHCARVAAALALPFATYHGDARERAATGKTSFETAARELRLEAYAHWCRADDLQAIAIGHSADDQVETVLGNLLRGTGIRGLRGMASSRPLHAGSTCRLIRPLLSIERAALLEFVRMRGGEPRSDSTNADLHHRRNRIRSDLLPNIRQHFNPNFDRACLALAREARAAHAGSGPSTPQTPTIAAGLALGPGVAWCDRRALGSFPDKQTVTSTLDLAWLHVTGRSTGLQRDHYHAWDQLVRGQGSGSHYDFPDGWRIERAADVLCLHASPGAELRPCNDSTLGVECVEWGLRVWIAGPESRCEFGADGVAEPLLTMPHGAQLRGVRTSDRLRQGAGHTRAKELLRSRGLPASLRRGYPVLARGTEVLWVPGLATAFAPTTNTSQAPALGWRGCLELDERYSAAFIVRQAMRRCGRGVLREDE
ncbi:MAG: tRNA lysidine(34) synthetase TilS [Planctomycetota bacterium]